MSEPEHHVWMDGDGVPLSVVTVNGRITPGIPGSKDSVVQRHGFQPRPDDLWIACHPKSGSHWLWQISNMILRNKAEPVKETIIGLEFAPIARLDEIPPPRVLLSHLGYHDTPREVLNKKTKTIHILRNPKDLAVSFYHHHVGLKKNNYSGSFSGYLALFMKHMLPVWSADVIEWHKQARGEDHVIFITYEEMSKDLLKVVRKVAAFLERSLSDELCRAIAEQCSFQVMKQTKEWPEMWKPGTEGFIRKGVVGDWKNWFTEEQNEEFDQVYRNLMRDSDIKVEFEI